MRIDKQHEIVGKKLVEVRELDLGTLYPVIDENQTVIGVASAEFGTPFGYYLNKELQAFCWDFDKFDH